MGFVVFTMQKRNPILMKLSNEDNLNLGGINFKDKKRMQIIF